MWAKGNLHTHTNLSDGDSAPDDVCRYYAARGYHFLSITDHNRFTDPKKVHSHGLVLLRGVEVSVVPECDRTVPIHVNGFGVRGNVVPRTGFTAVEALQNCVDAVLARAGVAQLNHPNFHFAFDHTQMSGITRCRLLEVFNGHPQVYNDGDGDHIGVEEMWDRLLTAGRVFHATAVDDSHHFTGDFAPHRANPSRGWVCARVKNLTPRSILYALRRGDFYASSGVELEDVAVRGFGLSLAVRRKPGVSCITRFIGDGGVVLSESGELENSFYPSSDSGTSYVRAKVIASNGSCAWTQPVFRTRAPLR